MVDQTSVPQRVAMGILFYPRGGSAQVVRYLSRALEHAGWATAIATGSLGDAGEESHAPTFHGRDDLVLADYTEALAWFERGDDPMTAPIPFHPSYEDRRGVPDRSFARVPPRLADHHISAWREILDSGSLRSAALVHLHHLTPLHDALDESTPVLTHLHGTELKFIARARQGLEGGGWAQWWADRLCAAARRSDLVVCISDQDRDLALELAQLDEARVRVIPNGVDIERFAPRHLDPAERQSLWRRWLVEDPQGWDSSGRPGSIRYREDDLKAFGSLRDPNPVLLYVGRFLEFKRVPLLIRAYARALPDLARPAPLVIWGGAPGEWEGEHPYEVARSEGVESSVFFVGWRGHEELPLGLATSDVLVGPSVDEPFGQVFLEAMAAGIPVVTTSTGGPKAFVQPGGPRANGWMVPPDDTGALAAALVGAVADSGERVRRGASARRLVASSYSWRSIASRFVQAYEEVLQRALP